VYVLSGDLSKRALSLETLAKSDDVIAAAAEPHARRRTSATLRDLMIVTMARCLPDLAPDELIAVVGRQTVDRGTEQ
jgi:hypothetical protein